MLKSIVTKLMGRIEEVGFNAEDIDRDLIAERLKEDVVSC